MRSSLSACVCASVATVRLQVATRQMVRGHHCDPRCAQLTALLSVPACVSPSAIYLELERMGFSVWYDNRADDLTKEGMLKGIEQAAVLILFLSVDVLNRPYCQMEIRHALALKKPVILLHGKHG